MTLEQYKLETMLEEWKSQTYKLDDSDNVYKCRPPEKVLTVKLEQYKLKGVLEKNKSSIAGNRICFYLFLVFLENCIRSCSGIAHKTCTNVDPL